MKRPASADSTPVEPARADAWRPPIVVSACLLGVACNHRGGASPSSGVAALSAEYRLIPVCPEVAGGLTTPRPIAERQADGRVTTVTGVDVTDAYQRGADHVVRVALGARASRAVLKARSPSCGCHEISDGSFRKTLVPGEGVAAQALRAAGVAVCSEEDIERTGTLRDPRGA